MTQAALKQFGQVDAAICNAGILSPIVPWLDCAAPFLRFASPLPSLKPSGLTLSAP